MNSIEVSNIVFVDEQTLYEASGHVTSCERCADDPAVAYDLLSAAIPFDYLLDAVTGCDPTVTEYLMCHFPQCPRCSCDLNEKTLVLTA